MDVMQSVNNFMHTRRALWITDFQKAESPSQTLHHTESALSLLTLYFLLHLCFYSSSPYSFFPPLIHFHHPPPQEKFSACQTTLPLPVSFLFAFCSGRKDNNKRSSFQIRSPTCYLGTVSQHPNTCWGRERQVPCCFVPSRHCLYFVTCSCQVCHLVQAGLTGPLQSRISLYTSLLRAPHSFPSSSQGKVLLWLLLW